MIIQRLLNAGIPVLVEQSNEITGEYAFESMTEEQRKISNIIILGWDEIRRIRNELLRETDWTQRPDAILTMEEKIIWQDYCQALRDIPQDFANPEEVVFPVKPGGV